MKITLDCGDYKPTINNVMNAELEGVYNGIGIPTDQGHFGICQRGSGLEITLDGKDFLSTEDPEVLKALQEIKARRDKEFEERMRNNKADNVPQANPG